jgi:HNH endonuclease
MRCIFCLNEREPSDEHVFPAAIGGALIIGRVCKLCNDFLGAKVDVLLTDHKAILLKRAEFGMGDRSGKDIDPWGRVFGDGSLASNPEVQIHLVPNPETGRMEPRRRYSSTPIKQDDGSEGVRIRLDVNQIGELEKIAQRLRKRAGQEPYSEDEIQALLASATKRTIEQPDVIFTIEMDTRHYQRAVCKIIYELAWFWLGDAYIDDPVAKKLRTVILSDTEQSIAARITMDGAEPPLSFWNGEPKAHIAMGAQMGDGFFVGVRVFDIVSGMIVVTNTASKYPSAADGRFQLFDLGGGDQSRDGTLEEEFFRMICSRRRDPGDPLTQS